MVKSKTRIVQQLVIVIESHNTSGTLLRTLVPPGKSAATYSFPKGMTLLIIVYEESRE